MTLPSAPTAPVEDAAPVDGILNYRALSLWALASCGLGLASGLALVHPLLWIVPLAAVACAVRALRLLARNDALWGRPLVVVGLLLALLFLGWGPGRALSRQWRLSSQAGEFAEQWLALVARGELEQAHQLTIDIVERQPPEISLREYYAAAVPEHQPLTPQSSLQEKFARFIDSSPVKELVAAGAKGRCSPLGDAGHFFEPNLDVVVKNYALEHEEDGRIARLPFQIRLHRRHDPKAGRAYWHIKEISPAAKVVRR